DLADIDHCLRNVPVLVSGATSPQHLFNRQQQAFAVGQHDVIKLVTLFLVDISRLQRLEIETNRGDRCLEFVCDGVYESVVLLIATYLADQKGCVEHNAKDQDHKKHHPEDEQHDFTEVENDPTNVQRNRQRDQTRAQRDKECY